MAKKKGARTRSTKPKAATLRLEQRLLNGKPEEFHIEEQHGRESAWHTLAKKDEGKVGTFSGRYLKALQNKTVLDRCDYIEGRLKRAGYRPIEIVTGEGIYDSFTDEERHRLRASQKFYVKFQNSMIIAIQLGEKPIEKGANFSAAHIDSPCLVGKIQKLKQNFNIAYLLAGPYGGVDAKDFFGTDLSLHIQAAVQQGRKDVMIRKSWGEKNGESVIYIPEESVHMGHGDHPSRMELKAVFSNRPYLDQGYDERKNVLLQVHNTLFKRWGMTQYDLQDAKFWLVPKANPSFGDFDYSTIVGYGQDNMASVFALLEGFLAARKPQYTKIAIFYDKEEVGDVGRGALRSNFVADIIMPALAYLTGKTLADHYTMSENSWSIFLDVIGAANIYEQSRHNPRDSAYLDSGVVIETSAGEVDKWQGFEPSVEFVRCTRRLLESNNIPYQQACMGTEEEKVGTSDDILHQDVYGQNITLAIPVYGMHRALEQTSVISNYYTAKAVEAFFSLADHNKYMPRGS